MGFRQPSEFPDGRPAIQYAKFWANEQEQATYEHAAEANPRREGEGSMTYIVRIASLVRARWAKVGTMPQGRLGAKAYARRIAELEAQRDRA